MPDHERTCVDCKYVNELSNKDHAGAYVWCSCDPVLPANALHHEVLKIRTRKPQDAARWIPRKLLTEKQHLLHTCPCWAPTDTEINNG